MAGRIASARDTAASVRPSCALLACCLALTGCRSRFDEPPVESKPPAPLCADPQLVTVKLEVPVAWVGTGDWNGDGAPDLVGASKGISQSFNDGSGGFGDPSDPAERRTQSFAAVSDFDRNGVDDVVLARASREVELFKGLRGVNLPRWSQVVMGYLPQVTGLATGDVDGDGAPDVVLLDADVQGPAVRILFGRDGVDFEPPTALSFPPTQGFVALADLDGDRHDDIAAPTGNDISVITLMYRSGGRFSSGPTISALTLPRPATALVFADFNEDGVRDVAACTPDRLGDNVFVGLGRGDGRFDGPLALRAGYSPQSLVALDWNLDGHLDLAVANSGTDHTVSIFYGAGDGTFSDPQPCQAVTFESTGGPTWVATSDFNRDGRPDLAFSYYDGISVIRNLTR